MFKPWKLGQGDFGFGVQVPLPKSQREKAVRKRRSQPSAAQRAAFDMFIRDWNAFPPGEYAASGCGCRVLVHRRGIVPSPCREHPNLVGANFVLPRHITEKAKQAFAQKLAYFRLPRVEVDSRILLALSQNAISWRREFGNPLEWQGKVFTLDDGCGCTFVAKCYKVRGEWMISRSISLWYAVRVGGCKKGPDFCQAQAYPVFPMAVRLGDLARRALNA